MRVNVGWKAIDASANFRYIGKMTVGGFATQNSEQGRPPTNADALPQIFYKERVYTDLRAQYKIDEGKRLYVGVDNAFDLLPPLDTTGLGSDAIYTNVGRFFYGGFAVKF